MATDAMPRPVALLASDGAEKHAAASTMILLCMGSLLVGCRESLFAAIGTAIEDTITGFDTGVFSELPFISNATWIIGIMMWGSMASRGRRARKTLLAIGLSVHGLATAATWLFIYAERGQPSALYGLRAVNGFFGAVFFPIAFSYVGDRFSDTSRGTCFGLIYASSQAGGVLMRSLAIAIGRERILGPWGWQWMIFGVGVLTIVAAVLMLVLLDMPPVKSQESGSCSQDCSVPSQMLKISSFRILVIQGLFGVVPWAAFNYRGFFFMQAGLNETEVVAILSQSSYASVFGTLLGGFLGDRLTGAWGVHGRVVAAEISIYIGIPIAFVIFMISPIGDAYTYYRNATFFLALMTAWVPVACNNPVLCALAPEGNRAIVFSWTSLLQVVLEGFSSAFGATAFTQLIGALGYDPECNDAVSRPNYCDDISNYLAVGRSIFIVACVGWAITGGLYSYLRGTYPKDIVTIHEERAQEAGAELAGALQA